MELASFRQLLTNEGQEAIKAASELNPREVDFLSHFQKLSKQYPQELARAALETAILRLEAGKKFPMAEKMYFTREALQQASSWEIAKYRAQRYKPFERVLDLGCSLGGDTLGLAGVSNVVGVDNDPLRLAMARANLEANGLTAEFIQTDLEQLPIQSAPAAFFDPARRANQRRIHSVEQYQPPLSIIKTWLARIAAMGVKISPGVKLDQLRDYPAEVEFISLRGGLKEAVLWLGPLKTVNRRATLLPGGHTMTDEDQDAKIPAGEPLSYIYEPDPAILRAGLVTTLGAQINARQIDPEIAYLTADKQTENPFARVWKVEDWMPFQLKRLRAYLRERNVGTVTVKKRGSPLVPEELIHDLRLKGDEEKVLFLTLRADKPIVIVCKPES